MSEMARRVSLDATAYMAMVHELRQYREAEQFPNVVPDFHLRKGTITGRDPTTYTATVLFGAADESDFPGVAVPGIRMADTVYPKVGASCFVAFQGPEPTILFTVGSGVGRCRLTHSVDFSITNGSTVPAPFDTELHDTDALHSTVTNNTRAVCKWPGQYRALGALEWGAASTTGVRRVCSLRHTRVASGGAAVPIGRRDEQFTVAGTVMAQQAAAQDFEMQATDYVEVTGFQGGTAPLVEQTSSATGSEYAPLLELVWTGPPVSVAP